MELYLCYSGTGRGSWLIVLAPWTHVTNGWRWFVYIALPGVLEQPPVGALFGVIPPLWALIPCGPQLPSMLLQWAWGVKKAS